jgi:hypothetical protein
LTDAEVPKKAKRGRELFAQRPTPAYESRPPDDESIRDTQRRARPWHETPVDDEGEEESE